MAKTRIKFSDAQPGTISYVAIGARYAGKWLFIKHRERGGYEIPAGHPEEGEDEEAAAARELIEETGAQEFLLHHVSYYSVITSMETRHGRLFYAEVNSLGEIGDRDEVESIILSEKLPDNVSLPLVMRSLFERLKNFKIEVSGQI